MCETDTDFMKEAADGVRYGFNSEEYTAVMARLEALGNATLVDAYVRACGYSANAYNQFLAWGLVSGLDLFSVGMVLRTRLNGEEFILLHLSLPMFAQAMFSLSVAGLCMAVKQPINSYKGKRTFQEFKSLYEGLSEG